MPSIYETINTLVSNSFEISQPSRRLISLSWFTTTNNETAKGLKTYIKGQCKASTTDGLRYFLKTASWASFKNGADYNLVIIIKTTNHESGKRFNNSPFLFPNVVVKNFSLRESKKGGLDEILRAFQQIKLSSGLPLFNEIWPANQNSLPSPTHNTSIDTSRPAFSAGISLASDHGRRIDDLEMEVQFLRDELNDLRNLINQIRQ
jgi:hypothetical protein